MRYLVLTLFLASAFASHQNAKDPTNWRRGYSYTYEFTGRLAWSNPHRCSYTGYIVTGKASVSPKSDKKLFVDIAGFKKARFDRTLYDGISGWISTDSLHFKAVGWNDFRILITLKHGKVFSVEIPSKLSAEAKFIALSVAANLQIPQKHSQISKSDKFIDNQLQLFGNCSVLFSHSPVSSALIREYPMYNPIPPILPYASLEDYSSKTQQVTCKGRGTRADPDAKTLTSSKLKIFGNQEEGTLQSSSIANELIVYHKHQKSTFQILYRYSIQFVSMNVRSDRLADLCNTVSLTSLEYTANIAEHPTTEFEKWAYILYIKGAHGIPNSHKHSSCHGHELYSHGHDLHPHGHKRHHHEYNYHDHDHKHGLTYQPEHDIRYPQAQYSHQEHAHNKYVDHDEYQQHGDHYEDNKYQTDSQIYLQPEKKLKEQPTHFDDHMFQEKSKKEEKKYHF